MSKKSFFLGVVTGVVLTFVVLIVIGLVIQKSDANFPAQYLEKPVSYEKKRKPHSGFSRFWIMLHWQQKFLTMGQSGCLQEIPLYFLVRTTIIIRSLRSRTFRESAHIAIQARMICQ